MTVRRSLIGLLCMLIFLTSSAWGQSLRVAVMPFSEGGYLDLSYVRKEELLTGVTQMVMDRLAQEPNLLLLEREGISHLLEEQKFQMSQFVDTSAVVELGRLMGADVMILGSIKEFGMGAAGGVSVGPFTVRGSRARVQLSGRLVSVRTGHILTSIQAEGDKIGAALEVDSFKGISFDSSHFRNSTLGKALTAAVDTFAREFMSAVEDLRSQTLGQTTNAVSGKIVAAKGSYFIVNIGENQGLATGDILQVTRMESFSGLEKPLRIPTGTLKVVSVDSHACVTAVLSTEGGMTVRVGDSVTVSTK